MDSVLKYPLAFAHLTVVLCDRSRTFRVVMALVGFGMLVGLVSVLR